MYGQFSEFFFFDDDDDDDDDDDCDLFLDASSNVSGQSSYWLIYIVVF